VSSDDLLGNTVAKVRVYELAKELGVESKTIMRSQGTWASSFDRRHRRWNRL